MDNLNIQEELKTIFSRYKCTPEELIPIMEAVQEAYGYLSENNMREIASFLRIPESKVFGVATFYSIFRTLKRGKYLIRVCDGTACHVKKSENILEVLEKELGLNKENPTTSDMLFTLETVACLGACGLAPVIMINDKVHGLMTPDSTLALLNTIKKEAAANDN